MRTTFCTNKVDLFNKLTSVFLCVCPVIDHKFRHNIVKVAVDGSVDYFDNVMTKFIVNNRTDSLKTDINLFFTITMVELPALAR